MSSVIKGILIKEITSVNETISINDAKNIPVIKH